jgi:hypothetical protein
LCSAIIVHPIYGKVPISRYCTAIIAEEIFAVMRNEGFISAWVKELYAKLRDDGTCGLPEERARRGTVSVRILMHGKREGSKLTGDRID